MSRLSELNQALIDVIVGFAASSKSAAAKEKSSEADLVAAAANIPDVTILSGENLPDMYVKLVALIESSTKVGSANSIFLHDLVDHILALEAFLKPVKQHAQAAAKNSTNPLHEQLIRGQKIPTRKELQQQLLNLALTAQKLPLEPADFEADCIAVKNEDEDQEGQEWLLTNETNPQSKKILRDNLFLALQLRPIANSSEVSAKLDAIFAEHEEFKRLKKENNQLTLANQRLTQAAAPQQLPRGPSSPHFKFSLNEVLAAVASGLTTFFSDDPDGNPEGRHTPPPM